jgi:hypothetical protein
MRRFALLLPFAALALAGCHGKGTGDLAKNVEESFDKRAAELDGLAEKTSNETVAETAREQAEAMRDEGDARKKGIEEAHTNAAAADPTVMNSVQPLPTK